MHGFKQKVDRTVDFYSETPQSQSARLLLTIAARDGLLVAAGDAEAAFLQAPLLEEVYVEPPPEAGEPRDVVYRALKALPGLRGSPVAWGAYATSVLTKTHKMEQSLVDPCLYHRPPCPKRGAHHLWALRHLDDFLFVGHAAKVRTLTMEMSKTLRLTDQTYLEQEGDTMRLLGCDITKVRRWGRSLIRRRGRS